MKSNLNHVYLSERLKRKLDRIPECPLTTIVAPAGYGKTTAIQMFQAELPENSAVIRQSFSGDSLQEFWADFSDILTNAVSEEMAEELRKMGIPSDGTTQREFFRLFQFRNIQERRPVYIVIEDCHTIRNARFYDFLLFACRNLPEGIHLILLSRTPVLQPWDQMLLGNKVNEITQKDLQFEENDVKLYFRECGCPIDEKNAEHLMASSEGWAAVISLNRICYENTGNLSDAKDIFSMIQSVLYTPLPLAERELLTSVSILSFFTSEQAAFVSGQQDAAASLNRLIRYNPFIRLEGEEYRLHGLLQEYMQRIFCKKSELNRANYLHRAGKWYLKQKDSLKAIRFFYAAGDFEDLMTAIEKGQGAGITAEHKDEMLAWFRECPEEIRNAHPLAVIVYARRLFTFCMKKECSEVLENLLGYLKNDLTLDRREKNNFLGEIEIVRSLLDYNDAKKMIAHQRRACELMDQPTNAVAPDSVWGYGSPSILAGYHRKSGALDEENRNIKEAMQLWYQLNPRQGSGAEHIFEGEMHFLRGEMTDAEICLHRAVHDAGKDDQPAMLIAARFLEQRIRIFQGDFTGVAPTLQEFRHMAGERREYMLLHTADLCEGWLYSLYDQGAGMLAGWLAEGRLEEARLLFPAVPVLHMVYGQVLLAQEKYGDLLEREKEERKLYRLYPNLLCEIYLDIQLSAACNQLGKKEQAVRYLEQALDAAAPDQIRLPFVENCDGIFRVLQELSEKRHLSEIMELISRFRKSKRMIMSSEFGRSPAFGLTDRELAIARMAASGSSNREIAGRLFLSENTIKSCLRTIFSKLSITDPVSKRMALRKLFSED